MLAFYLIEDDLAHAQMAWSDFHIFIGLYILESLFKAENDGRNVRD